MNTAAITGLSSLVSLALACESESHSVAPRLEAMSFANSEWSEPVNLGPVVNSSSNEQNATLARDGLSLYFSSNRPGGSGPLDIWVSQRACTDPEDAACAWEAPVILGPVINGSGADFAPKLSLYGHPLFFSSVPTDGVGGPGIYPSHPAAAVTVRVDGKELMFWSTRPGGLGGADLWLSTRQTVHDSWSPPVNLPAPLNSSSDDVTPSLSFDGRTLIFASNRPGGSGGNDIYMSTRTPSGKE